MNHKNDAFDFIAMSGKDYEKTKKDNGWGLTLEEFRQAQKRAGKKLTMTEAYILDSLWSNHCSYKHSRHKLKSLVRENRYVHKSKQSDAGAVRIGSSDFCAVFKIESHNHPTLINPFDGAATGAGGIMRDIFAMGAINIGVGASLRYGDKQKPESKDILKEAMKGAAHYCGKMEIPLTALDIYYDNVFKNNCLMNVSAIGIVKKNMLIPNVVPEKSVGYNLIYIGKPTAGAAVGGASFASQAFEEGKEKEIEFGSNPELEKATFDAFEKVKKALAGKKLLSEISMKDMGAAGLTCSTAEQVSERGYGIEILTDKVPVPDGMNVHPLALAVGEDQERNMVIASEKASKVVMEIFRRDSAFKKYGGKVEIIGKVIKSDRFIMKDDCSVYCDIPLSVITESPEYKPLKKKPATSAKIFSTPKPLSIEAAMLSVLASENVRYKKDVFGMFKQSHAGWLHTKTEETDVCVLAPLKKEKKNGRAGIALVFGGKSAHGRNGTPAEQAYIATVSARLKLAAAGLKPVAAADGCNYGDPENHEHYYSFSAGIDGLNKACKIPLYGEKELLAVVAGNVSLKNTYISKGKERPIDPSMIPAVFGYISDYSNTVTNGLKRTDSAIFLIGVRKHEFKGSEYAALFGQTGKNLPYATPSEAGKLEYAILEAAGKELLLASALIENGGLAAALTKMAALGKNDAGVMIDMSFCGNMRHDYALFSESLGYTVEVKHENSRKLEKIFKKHGIYIKKIGVTTSNKSFTAKAKDRTILEIPLKRLREHWGKK